MLVMPPDGFEWPTPFVPISDETVCLLHAQLNAKVFGTTTPESTLAAELQRETCSEHPLHGWECKAVAHATDNHNEFMFATNHPNFPVAFVHLTWCVESSPTFPNTRAYCSWDAFKQEWLKREAQLELAWLSRLRKPWWCFW